MYKLILVIVFLFIGGIAFPSEEITGFEDKDLPVLNEELRKIKQDIATKPKDACWIIFESDDSVATGNGTVALTISSSLGGRNLVDVLASVHTKGVTNTTDIQ
ncbi:unnamed protein product, partial [marine sediment metagenome]